MPKNENLRADIDPPVKLIQDMYLEINSIAQGLNIGILLLVFTRPQDIINSLASTYYSTPVLALTNFIISIVFWARYYFDTRILHRSYTTFAVVWFFAFILAQGISISSIYVPQIWFTATGVFLMFGVGFYVLNLSEIRRKQRAGVLDDWPNFVKWQKQRLIDLIFLSLLSFTGLYFVEQQLYFALPASLFAFILAIWQLIMTNDYRRKRFISTGI